MHKSFAYEFAFGFVVRQARQARLALFWVALDMDMDMVMVGGCVDEVVNVDMV